MNNYNIRCIYLIMSDEDAVINVPNLDTLPVELLDKIAEDCISINNWLSIWAVNSRTYNAAKVLDKKPPITRFIARFSSGRTINDMMYNISDRHGEYLQPSDIDTILQTLLYNKEYIDKAITNDIFIRTDDKNISGAIYFAIHRILKSLERDYYLYQKYIDLLCQFQEYIVILHDWGYSDKICLPNYIVQYLRFIDGEAQGYNMTEKIENIKINSKMTFPYAEIITSIYAQPAHYSRVNDPNRYKSDRKIRASFNRDEWQEVRNLIKDNPHAAFVKIINKASIDSNIAKDLIIH